MASEEETIKLNDEGKLKLIEFYKKNKELWTTNFSRTSRNLKKSKLNGHFEGKFQLETLEKAFHGLKASFLREFKKFQEGNLPKRKWKFYDSVLFLKEEQTTPTNTKNVLSVEQRETLITFYQNHPALWNHGLNGYRDRNLRRVLLCKLVEEFEDKFTEEDIKREWHNMLTRYKREKNSENNSRKSGTGIDDVFSSTWEHFNQMSFLESNPECDASISTLDDSRESTPPAPKKAKSSKDTSQDAKIALWSALANSLNANQNQATENQQRTRLEERADLFGKTVADHLIQCDPKDWTMLRKKIVDIFYYYEQSNLSQSQPAPLIPLNSFSNFGFPPASTLTNYVQSSLPPQSPCSSNAYSPCGSNQS